MTMAMSRDGEQHPAVSGEARQDRDPLELPVRHLARRRRRHPHQALEPAANRVGEEAHEVVRPGVVPEDCRPDQKERRRGAGDHERPEQPGRRGRRRPLDAAVMPELPGDDDLDEQEREDQPEGPAGDVGADRQPIDEQVVDRGGRGVRLDRGIERVLHELEVGDGRKQAAQAVLVEPREIALAAAVVGSRRGDVEGVGDFEGLGHERELVDAARIGVGVAEDVDVVDELCPDLGRLLTDAEVRREEEPPRARRRRPGGTLRGRCRRGSPARGAGPTWRSGSAPASSLRSSASRARCSSRGSECS